MKQFGHLIRLPDKTLAKVETNKKNKKLKDLQVDKGQPGNYCK